MAWRDRGHDSEIHAIEWDLDTVYFCDTFSGVPKAGEHDTIYIGGEHADTDATVVTQLMTKMPIENVVYPRGLPRRDRGLTRDEEV